MKLSYSRDPSMTALAQRLILLGRDRKSCPKASSVTKVAAQSVVNPLCIQATSACRTYWSLRTCGVFNVSNRDEPQKGFTRGWIHVRTLVLDEKFGIDHHTLNAVSMKSPLVPIA